MMFNPLAFVSPVVDYINDPIFHLRSERIDNRMFVFVNLAQFEIINGELWETEVTPRPENE